MSAVDEYERFARDYRYSNMTTGEGVRKADAAIAALEAENAAFREKEKLFWLNMRLNEATIESISPTIDGAVVEFVPKKMLEQAEAELQKRDVQEGNLTELWKQAEAELEALRRRIKEANEWLYLEDPCVDFPLAVREMAEELAALKAENAGYRDGAQRLIESNTRLCKRAEQAEAELEKEKHANIALVVLCKAKDAELMALRCCCKCVHSDHDMHHNWWCEFDPEPMNPNEYSTIEEHENCHFTPSRWTEE